MALCSRQNVPGVEISDIITTAQFVLHWREPGELALRVIFILSTHADTTGTNAN